MMDDQRPVALLPVDVLSKKYPYFSNMYHFEKLDGAAMVSSIE